jgi:hypothetical protein
MMGLGHVHRHLLTPPACSVLIIDILGDIARAWRPDLDAFRTENTSFSE